MGFYPFAFYGDYCCINNITIIMSGFILFIYLILLLGKYFFKQSTDSMTAFLFLCPSTFPFQVNLNNH